VRACARVCRDRQIKSSQDVCGNEHDGCDQEEDAGDEAGERKCVRQGRSARAEAQRAEDGLREGLHCHHYHHHEINIFTRNQLI